MKPLMMNNELPVQILEKGQSVCDVIKQKTQKYQDEGLEEAFFVVELSDVVKKYEIWQEELPRVQPFYAVKCCEDPALLQILANLGTGFDCASKAEIKRILDLGMSPDRIIYANPCKQNSYIKYAKQNEVNYMTFDNEIELHKVKAIFPEAKLVLRLLPPDNTKVQCQLGNKFGCPPKQARQLLEKAKQLQLDVVGISFHVGSGCYDASAFSTAVVISRSVFDIGLSLGFDFHLLDIGGGFPGHPGDKITFPEICAELRPALNKYFPEGCGVRLIAEPGRYFAASAFTLVVNVIAKRTVARDIQPKDNADSVSNSVVPSASDEPAHMYYVNDGVYGSFNCLLYDHASVEPIPVKESDDSGAAYSSSIWGPTCDGLDCISDHCLMQEQDIGDWIMFKNMGAYTLSAGCTFNGMPRPQCHYVIPEDKSSYVLSLKMSDPAPVKMSAMDYPPFELPTQLKGPTPQSFVHQTRLAVFVGPDN